MRILEHVDLSTLNTFGIKAEARYFVEIHQEEELNALLKTPLFKENKHLFLGGGSNVLLKDDFEGLAIKLSIKGIESKKESEDHVWLRVGAGEVWHELVLYAIENDLAGIENLSLIPGTVGAAPMQNIGAYGVELKEVFDSLQAIEIKTGKTKTFDNQACQFGYRSSIFKTTLKNQYIITSVTLRLNKKPSFNVTYGAIQEVLLRRGIKHMSIKAVSDAVIEIRQSKLPDPKEIGNAGSFFKNPTIPKTQFESLKMTYPNMPGYHQTDMQVKVPAGWLIEQCGWKGKRIGETGSHVNQALVLVNYGAAKGEEIWNLAKEIKASVWDKFGIEIEPEVNAI